MSMQPQSSEDIRPFVEQLNRIDPLLEIVWDPKARVVVTGSYSVTGKRIDPVYDGRWRVIRYDSPEYGHAGFHPERGFTVVCEVTEYGEQDGVLFMIVDGAFAPIDQRIVSLLRAADTWNTEQFKQHREKLWRQNDALEASENDIDEGMAIAGLDHAHFVANFAGGVGNWQGKGADFKAMEARATKAAVQRILTTKG